MNSTTFHVVSEKEGSVTASKLFFERECILYVCDTYTKHYYIDLRPDENNCIRITLHAKNKAVTEEILKTFLNDLIDQQIRLDLQKEFGSLRQHIVRYAFAPVESHHA